MNSQEKEASVSALVDQFKGAELAVLIGYQGCTCAELTSLRKKLKPSGAKFAVVKNSLASRALKGTDGEKLEDLFVGPTGVIWSPEDPVGPAKVLKDFAKEIEKFSIKGGIIGDKILSTKDIETLAALPSREEILSNLLALINAPATRLLQTMNAPATQLVRTLGAWQTELEKRGGSAGEKAPAVEETAAN